MVAKRVFTHEIGATRPSQILWKILKVGWNQTRQT